MAQFSLNAEITLKANDAIRAIQAFERGARNSKKEFSLFGRTITLDTKRMVKNLATMGAILGGIFAVVASQSPHLRAEFKRLAASTLLFNVAIGEILQPTIERLVDGIIFLQEKFLGLPPRIQEVIIIAGFLALALTVASIAAIALWTALGPITLAIIGVSIAIAALLVFAPEIEAFGKTVSDMGLIISESLIAFTRNVDTTISDFFGQFGKFGAIIGDIVSLIVDFILIIPLTVIDMAATVIQIFGDLMTAIGALFQGDFGGVVEALGNMFIRVINMFVRMINRMLIGPLNKALRLIDDVAESFGGDLNFRIPEVSEVASLQEGGEIRQDGLIFAHRKERILTASENRAGGRGGNQGGTTIINNYNSFKIGSVDSKKRIREMMRESDRVNKRNMDRRFKT